MNKNGITLILVPLGLSLMILSSFISNGFYQLIALFGGFFILGVGLESPNDKNCG